MRPVGRLLQERQGHQAASAGPCFAPLFGNASLSDLDVLIQEEPAPSQGATRPAAEQPAAAVTLPANVAVLYSLSEFVRNKVDNWSDEQQQGQRRQLLLLVPPGQVTTGRLLVEAMYMDAPDLSHLGLGELLALLALADSYSVPKVAAFAAAALTKAAAAGQLPWDGMLAVLNLPDACLKLPGCEPVRAAAVKQLQQELGDLEAVWNSTDKSERLLGLPLSALKQLLADDATQADSEDTVVYTIERWFLKNTRAPGDLPDSDIEGLGRVLRLPHCSPSYMVGACEHSSSWLPWAFPGGGDLLKACFLAANRSNTALLHSKWAQRFPAWSLPQRPASSSNGVAGVLQFDWELPLVQLEDLLMKGLDKKAGQEAVLDGPQVRAWQGRRWGLQATVHSKGIGLYVTVQHDKQSALSMVSASVAVQRHEAPCWTHYDQVVVEGRRGRVGNSSVIWFKAHQRGVYHVREMLQDLGFLEQGSDKDGGLVLHLQAEVVGLC